jgi:hypothetical protein
MRLTAWSAVVSVCAAMRWRREMTADSWRRKRSATSGRMSQRERASAVVLWAWATASKERAGSMSARRIALIWLSGGAKEMDFEDGTKASMYTVCTVCQ